MLKGSSRGNLGSTITNPEVIEEYVRKELQQGRIAGPVLEDMSKSIYVSIFGVIPKGYTPGR